MGQISVKTCAPKGSDLSGNQQAYYLQKEKGSDAEDEADRVDRLIDCQNKLEFIISKQRNGPVGTVDLFVDIACSAVRNGARSW